MTSPQSPFQNDRLQSYVLLANISSLLLLHGLRKIRASLEGYKLCPLQPNFLRINSFPELDVIVLFLAFLLLNSGTRAGVGGGGGGAHGTRKERGRKRQGCAGTSHFLVMPMPLACLSFLGNLTGGKETQFAYPSLEIFPATVTDFLYNSDRKHQNCCLGEIVF